MQHSASCTVKRFLAVQQRSADWSSEVVEIHDVPPTLSQYVIQGLKPGHIYIFQVRAVNLGRIAFSHRTSSSHSFSSSCRFFCGCLHGSEGTSTAWGSGAIAASQSEPWMEPHLLRSKTSGPPRSTSPLFASSARA